MSHTQPITFNVLSVTVRTTRSQLMTEFKQGVKYCYSDCSPLKWAMLLHDRGAEYPKQQKRLVFVNDAEEIVCRDIDGKSGYSGVGLPSYNDIVPIEYHEPIKVVKEIEMHAVLTRESDDYALQDVLFGRAMKIYYADRMAYKRGNHPIRRFRITVEEID